MRAIPAGFPRRGPWLIVACGMVVLALTIGIRLTFGLFLPPMTAELGWGRETFAFAIALQNIVWGMAQPLAGMIADRHGSGRVIVVGGIGYALGLLLMSQVRTPLALHLVTGLLIGLSLSAASFSVVLGAVGRAVGEKRRSLALGIASAGGSMGQFAMLPLGGALIASDGWVSALVVLAAIAAVIVPLAGILAGRPPAPAGRAAPQRLGQALAEAGRHRGYWLLTAGFFVCGFHITFIGTHLPAFIADHALSPALGATALATIGFFNIIGTYAWGALGGRQSKKGALSLLYLIRAGVIAAFLAVPVTERSILFFAAAMGFLWLGTVPLTSALVGQIFGVRYLSTLLGIVFLSHQAGAFLGVWLGGRVYDATGSYDPVWYAAIALGLLSAALHWPIDERPVARLRMAAEEA